MTRNQVVAGHDHRYAGVAKRLGDEGDIRLVERPPVAAVDEKQNRGAIAGGKNIEQATRARRVALIQNARAFGPHNRAAAFVLVINHVAFGMPLTQRELGFESLVDHCHYAVRSIRV